jgi:hypothetical protein
LELPRIPLEHGGIQVNHCRTPGCLNFGKPALTEDVSLGRPRSDGSGIKDVYKVVGGGKGVPAIDCDGCKVKVLLKSNRGIREEVDRISAYLTPEPAPSAACTNRRCENHGKSAEQSSACDERRPPPFRKYARLWLQSDYEKAAKRKARIRLASTAKQEVRAAYDELQSRDDDDPDGEINELVRLPRRGVQVHNEYTIFGHFHHLRELFRNVEKTRLVRRPGQRDAGRGAERLQE